MQQVKEKRKQFGIIIIFFILICIGNTLFCQTKDSLNFQKVSLNNGYLSKVQIWSPFTCYFFYVYTNKEISKINFRITDCNSLLIIDEDVKYIYINDYYPNEILKIQDLLLEAWRRKIPSFSKKKKQKYINKELTYYISSTKCDLTTIKYNPNQKFIFEKYWGEEMLPDNVNSEVEKFIAIDIILK